ncbi:MAG: sulfatase-like hydrolase/transferase [Lentisphaerae bacterium]|jgi:arylsulfatase A-like enzyme|nr:sulfatase-like hydrolase/transferase [Lentisphaerota bacterium]MBT5605871.1 sulfatase-like hydrolase/transferase [Lentisphaerota bacterium]MBT7055960.1 sulfatase-like hydrolase/transferase [Lentisphaerota bacterium]MBT7841547.1 sulfatase-like hydrolase/transferase [Lentisphaerota bacterium]
MKKRAVSKLIGLMLLAGLVQAQANRPNVLLIAIDDLNDWIGCLGGHPQAKTPNMDRLAARGVLFNNAHCQSPVCNPSRASMMTSLYPATTGIYFLSPDLAKSPVARKSTLMPHRFQQEGYHVTGAGKIFHGSQNKKYLPNYAGGFGGIGPSPKKKISSFPGHPLWDWGVFPDSDEKVPDHKIAAWCVAQLQKQHDKPLFLATGFYRPHVPQYAPKKWFDMYPLESLKLPTVLANDLDDLSEYGINLTRLKHVAPTHEWVLKNNEWKPLVQSYLACVSFVDHQVGKLLDALDDSPYKDNTFIVLYTDHGFHLGEKERWAKRSLWEDGTRVPMIIAGPGVVRGDVCSKPVQLLDVYPTLLELTGLKKDETLEGNSMVPLLKNPGADWPHMARTSFGPGNVSICSERYRYIHYNDGSEEFYDHADDPHEWDNLIADPKVAKLVEKHRASLPKTSHPILGANSTGHRAFNASKAMKLKTQQGRRDDAGERESDGLWSQRRVKWRVKAESSHERGAWGLEKLVDGITTSQPKSKGYSSDGAKSADSPTWLEIELGQQKAIKTITLFPRTDTKSINGMTAGFPVDLTISLRTPGGAYTVAKTLADISNPQGKPYEIGLSKATGSLQAASIRIEVTKRGLPPGNEPDAYRLQLAELEVDYAESDPSRDR